MTDDLPRAAGSARSPSIGDDQAVLVTVAKLAADKFAPRAVEYDRKAVFPAEDFDDLFSNGFLGVTVPCEYGGLGYGP
ncbi:acyl-CoA dehydrogenase family protein [Streptomyces sp. NPDC047453]|uniref:acyl-CoA dehydrogenase family protein n=1 Tax=Streptomyces sp. NPDC047453 TaxID=3154812 RepID=UPI0033D59088